jgi:hypothetical protein
MGYLKIYYGGWYRPYYFSPNGYGMHTSCYVSPMDRKQAGDVALKIDHSKGKNRISVTIFIRGFIPR